MFVVRALLSGSAAELYFRLLYPTSHVVHLV